MRIAARAVALVLILTGVAKETLSQQTSAVIAPQASVYSQASTRSRMMQTLQQGQRVLIDMTISNSEGTWCLIREPDAKDKPGYIPCAQLTSEAMPKAVPTIPVFEPSASPVTSGDESKGSAAARDPYALTEAQIAEINRLKEAYGIEALRDDAVRAYRRFGVTDDFSALNRVVEAGKRPYSDSFFVVMEPKIKRGAVQYRAFWKAYWNLLTQEQKTAFVQRDPAFLLAYLHSQSDPESAFNAYVLQELRRTSRAK